MQERSLNLRFIVIGLIIVLVLLEYRFWFSADSIIKVYKLKTAVNEQQQDIAKLQLRNKQLSAKIANLKTYPASIEEQARYELGMVKQGEKYYQVVDPIE